MRARPGFGCGGAFARGVRGCLTFVDRSDPGHRATPACARTPARSAVRIGRLRVRVARVARRRRAMEFCRARGGSAGRHVNRMRRRVSRRIKGLEAARVDMTGGGGSAFARALFLLVADSPRSAPPATPCQLASSPRRKIAYSTPPSAEWRKGSTSTCNGRRAIGF